MIMWTLLLFALCINKQVELAVIKRKYVHQKDISEYCRRGVIPSVFIGRHTVGSFSQILPFSRLEIPYNCFISIRAEPSMNIILVVEFQSVKTLRNICEQSGDQFLAYELVETFGGYWAIKSDILIGRTKNLPSKVYTLETYRPSSKTTSIVTNLNKKHSVTTEKSDKVSSEIIDKKYDQIEVPLLNVSARVVPGDLPTDVLFNVEELFDVQYDVNPKVGVDYSTKIVPIVQFSRSKISKVNDNLEAEFNYTPDERLTLPPTISTTKKKNRNYNRLIKFGKRKHLFSPAISATTKQYPPPRRQYEMKPNEIVTRNYGFMRPSSVDPHPWEAVDDIMKHISNTRYVPQDFDSNLSDLLRGLSKANDTKSAVSSSEMKIRNNKITLSGVVTPKAGGTARIRRFSRRSRQKRYIRVIPIRNALPHHIYSTPSDSEAHSRGWVLGNNNFQRLIEIENDDVQNYRVSLRHMSNFTGALLYNICHVAEPTTRHVYVLNSSRVVLALHEFSLERIRVVVTPTYILSQPEERCRDDEIECQVSGRRACIDLLSSCDGIPNCGSYDVYDEDRLVCGVSRRYKNLWLASITVLAILLACFYTVHHWLKRCVPKVADAFFIYKETTDNILNLESIMKPPLGHEDKIFYGDPSLHLSLSAITKPIIPNRLLIYWKRFSKLFRKRNKKASAASIMDDDICDMQLYRHKASVANTRLSMYKNTCNAYVQTGSSLEMKDPEAIRLETIKTLQDSVMTGDIQQLLLSNIVTDSQPAENILANDRSSFIDSLIDQASSELSIIKYFQRPRSASMNVYRSNTPSLHEESPDEELIRIHELGKKHEQQSTQINSEITVHEDVTEEADSVPHTVKKRLRFVDGGLGSVNASSDTLNSEEKQPVRRGVLFSGMDAIEETAEPNESSLNKGSKTHFWSKKKEKKLKKKTSKY